jgi:hypothetical protein
LSAVLDQHRVEWDERQIAGQVDVHLAIAQPSFQPLEGGAQHAFELFASLRTAFVIHGVERFVAYLYSQHLSAKGTGEARAAS